MSKKTSKKSKNIYYKNNSIDDKKNKTEEKKQTYEKELETVKKCYTNYLFLGNFITKYYDSDKYLPNMQLLILV